MCGGGFFDASADAGVTPTEAPILENAAASTSAPSVPPYLVLASLAIGSTCGRTSRAGVLRRRATGCGLAARRRSRTGSTKQIEENSFVMRRTLSPIGSPEIKTLLLFESPQKHASSHPPRAPLQHARHGRRAPFPEPVLAGAAPQSPAKFGQRTASTLRRGLVQLQVRRPPFTGPTLLVFLKSLLFFSFLPK